MNQNLPSPQEVATKQFSLARRGFDPDEVRAYLAELSRAISATTSSLVQAQDQLALGRPGTAPQDLRSQVDALQAEVRALGNRLAVAQAVRDDAVAQKAQMEKLVAGLDVAAGPAPAPVGGDELDRASNELAEVLRDAKLRAAQIKADAERDASLIVERARRDSDQLRISAQLQAEQATVRLQERLAELCREAEGRVVVANTEAARILAAADDSAARSLEHAQFQARRLVANAGTFSSIWVAETEELRLSSGGSDVEQAPVVKRSVTDALAAFDASLLANPSSESHDTDSDIDSDADTDADTEREDGGATVLTVAGQEDPEELLRQADHLLSIAEVVRRAEVDHAKRSGSSNGARPA